jgi:hypothetical protein
MNLQELTIGNYVIPLDTLIPGEVILIEEGGVLLNNRQETEDEANLEGIELNEEWLYQLGFSFNLRGNTWEYYGKNKALSLRIKKTGDYFQFDMYKIKHVHELQNLIKILMR